MRTRSSAAKRAAMDDSSDGEGPADGGRNKRPALANISNNSVQCSAGCSSMKAAEEGVESKGKARAGQARITTKKASCMGTAAATCTGSAQAESHAAPAEMNEEQVEALLEARTDDRTLPGDSAAIASLERRTVLNLHISSEPSCEPAGNSCEAGNGSMEPERKAWTCSLGYTSIDNNPKDPQMCSIYAADIYQHLRLAELRRRPKTNFIETVQEDVTANMRGILVDWLVEVAEEYKLVPDTLYLTCSYIDRYLSGNAVTRSRLQLLGVSCMLIAAKYEEIYAPQVEEFCYITDNTYRRDEVLDMEKKVLNDLRFELSTPTTKSFLRRFIRAAQVSLEAPSLKLEFLGNYLAELTLVDYSFLGYLPSMVAASAVFLAKLTIDPHKQPWTPTLQHYTGYRPEQIKQCVLNLHSLHSNHAGTLPAIREKYSQSKFKSVASLPPSPTVPLQFFEDVR